MEKISESDLHLLQVSKLKLENLEKEHRLLIMTIFLNYGLTKEDQLNDQTGEIVKTKPVPQSPSAEFND